MAQVALENSRQKQDPAEPLLDLEAGADSRLDWLASVWAHRAVVLALARKDFQTRYKRASLGVLWAVVVPLLQASVMIFLFSHFIHTPKGVPYAAYVLSGVMAWSYFSQSLPAGTTAIVDGTDLTDKLWFPRVVLPLVPCVANLVVLGIAMLILLFGSVILSAPLGIHTLLLIPGCLLLILFTVSLTMTLSALQVYFRDVKFIATATLTVWLYATPIMYPKYRLGSFAPWLDFNPMTGIVSLFHVAIIGHDGSWIRSLVVSLVTTAFLLVAAMEIHRRHDRLFVDLL